MINKQAEKLNEYLKLLREKELEVDVDKGVLYILLDEKDYHNKSFTKNVQAIMAGYGKTWGIRMKEVS